MISVVDIFRSIVANIDLKIKVKSVNGFIVYVCDTKHITIHKVIEDSDGKTWKVKDFKQDEWVELTPLDGQLAFEATHIFAPKPLFIHGNASSANSEYLRVSQITLEKTPFIWLLSGYTEREFGVMSAIGLEVTARLFFMDETNEREWINDEHLKYTIKPMRKLAGLMVEAIEKDGRFPTLTERSFVDRARFGVEVVNKGNASKIIDDDLSGTQLDLPLKIYKEHCKC